MLEAAKQIFGELSREFDGGYCYIEAYELGWTKGGEIVRADPNNRGNGGNFKGQKS